MNRKNAVVVPLNIDEGVKLQSRQYNPWNKKKQTMSEALREERAALGFVDELADLRELIRTTAYSNHISIEALAEGIGLKRSALRWIVWNRGKPTRERIIFLTHLLNNFSR